MDDDELEGTEEFFLTLTSCSPDVVGVDQNRATKTVFIMDDECRSASNTCVANSN